MQHTTPDSSIRFAELIELADRLAEQQAVQSEERAAAELKAQQEALKAELERYWAYEVNLAERAQVIALEEQKHLTNQRIAQDQLWEEEQKRLSTEAAQLPDAQMRGHELHAERMHDAVYDPYKVSQDAVADRFFDIGPEYRPWLTPENKALELEQERYQAKEVALANRALEVVSKDQQQIDRLRAERDALWRSVDDKNPAYNNYHGFPDVGAVDRHEHHMQRMHKAVYEPDKILEETRRQGIYAGRKVEARQIPAEAERQRLNCLTNELDKNARPLGTYEPLRFLEERQRQENAAKREAEALAQQAQAAAAAKAKEQEQQRAAEARQAGITTRRENIVGAVLDRKLADREREASDQLRDDMREGAIRALQELDAKEVQVMAARGWELRERIAKGQWERRDLIEFRDRQERRLNEECQQFARQHPDNAQRRDALEELVARKLEAILYPDQHLKGKAPQEIRAMAEEGRNEERQRRRGGKDGRDTFSDFVRSRGEEAMQSRTDQEALRANKPLARERDANTGRSAEAGRLRDEVPKDRAQRWIAALAKEREANQARERGRDGPTRGR